jgi:biopolymer transport protein ExbD
VLTVLVFFLLVNQIGVSVLGIELPGPAVASAEPPPVQDLSVIVRADSLTLANNGAPMETYGRSDRGYDYDGLVAKLTELKRATPDDTRISLLLDPGIPYETLVSLMDSVRETTATVAEPAAELFPDVSVGVAPPAAEPAAAEAAP